MAKVYDITKAKEIIETRKNEIMAASLGMYEDWFWTAITVFEGGEWQRELNEGDEIAGIKGSSWATPTLRLELLDGTDECIPCYTGNSTIYQPPYPLLGALSEPVQNAMPPLKFDDLQIQK